MKTVPNIPKVFDSFSENYINDVNGWGFNRDTIEKEKGKLLTLDVDFGSNCSLNCPLCFRINNSADTDGKELQYKDLVKLIHEAKELGLRSVKFLGKGEPFENERFLDYLRFLYSENIVPLIFTKGHVIGNENLVKKYYSDYGITTSKDLVEELNKLNVSIILGFNSFDDDIQAKMVGNNNGYISHRNKALELLVDSGFNSTNPTRLALAINPITKWNIGETFEIYKWGRERNLYCIVTPSMISGRAKDKTWRKVNPSDKEIINLYKQIYQFNLESGLQTKNEIITEGISSYAGGHPCNQVACGLYITLNGVVLSCPGNESSIEGNVLKDSLTNIWTSSLNNKIRSGIFNCKCVAKDGYSIPLKLYDIILEEIK